MLYGWTDPIQDGACRGGVDFRMDGEKGVSPCRGWVRHLPAMSLSVFVLLAASIEAEACSVQRYSFSWGSDTRTTVTVGTGQLCGSNLRIETGAIESISIVRAPANGTARASANRWEYRSRLGFQGQDEFMVALTGHGARGRGTTNIVVSVNVGANTGSAEQPRSAPSRAQAPAPPPTDPRHARVRTHNQ